MRVSLKESVRQTLGYAQFFDYDLTASELHHWLISPKKVSLSALKSIIYDLRSSLSRKRLLRQKISRSKFLQARRVANLLRFIPSIKMIAITGSLAMNNAKKVDDIDLMIVTKEGALWITRLLVIPLVRLFFKSRLPARDSKFEIRDSICMNLWLDTSALTLPGSKRSLYTAHEVLQVKPLLNRHHTYERFIHSNSWTKEYLANAWQGITASLKHPSGGWVKRSVTPDSRRVNGQRGGFLRSMIYDLTSKANLLAFRLQLAYMHSKMTSETVSLNSAYFHPRSLAKSLDQHLKPHNL